jgi:hypothetical protein
MTASSFYGPGRAIPSNLEDVGFIAQKIADAWQAVNPNLPNVVSNTNDFIENTSLSGSDNYYRVNYIRLIPIVTAAAKELSTQVRELSTKLYNK